MRKLALAAALTIVGVNAYCQSVKVSTYTTHFQWSNDQVSSDKLFHFQTQDYKYNTEVTGALNSGQNDITDGSLLSKPINYGFNVAFAPEKLTFSKGALYFVVGYSKLVQQEKFLYSNVTDAANSEYETIDGKFFIDRSYFTTGFAWNETLLSKEKWDLVLGFEYLFQLNTNTNSHVTVRKDTQDGVEFVNSMERLDVPAVNIFSMGISLSPQYKLNESSNIALDLGVKTFNYTNKVVYDKSQLNLAIGLVYQYKF